jgi:hypothetical protein
MAFERVFVDLFLRGRKAKHKQSGLITMKHTDTRLHRKYLRVAGSTGSSPRIRKRELDGRISSISHPNSSVNGFVNIARREVKTGITKIDFWYKCVFSGRKCVSIIRRLVSIMSNELASHAPYPATIGAKHQDGVKVSSLTNLKFLIDLKNTKHSS